MAHQAQALAPRQAPIFSALFNQASILKSTPCAYMPTLSFNDISLSTAIDWMKVGRLHCLYPWWQDATVNFMLGGGYSISNLINKFLVQVKFKVQSDWLQSLLQICT
ncbi:alpha/beta hydrolase domain-containing protein VTE7-like isoform X2 [Euphorbia lathyris]